MRVAWGIDKYPRLCNCLPVDARAWCDALVAELVVALSQWCVRELVLNFGGWCGLMCVPRLSGVPCLLRRPGTADAWATTRR